MAKAVMIQGTMSNVGKSLFSTALCRILKQDGYKVAPFKSQNMALNSYITKDGLEIGRAQVVQAEASGVEPSVLMNPILLKPTTDSGSQIIVNGEIYGNMRAVDYFRNKKNFINDIIKAYSELEKNYDIIVIEGAGSPVEMNLKKNDIVNMGMAKIAKSPVLLVGDIDRGGVFAQLLGTLSLFEKDEFNMVKGLVVNKFRGDRRLFDDGVKILEQRGNKPVIGVVPFINCDIDDEDSLSQKLKNDKIGLIDIAVIKLPKISNFTDLDVFSQYRNVSVRYVEKAENLKNPDLIIIPGTKSTVADMKWLRESGLETEIKKCCSRDIPIFGICGGYQILGKKISDPYNTECGGEISGMGLLDTQTVFKNEKVRTRVKGKVLCSDGFFSVINNSGFYGYEIHMGKTVVNEKSFVELDNGSVDGAYKKNVCGSYVHGIFDSEDISEKIVKELFRKKGFEYNDKSVDRRKYKEMQYDILADNVRRNIDMNFVYKIIEEGI